MKTTQILIGMGVFIVTLITAAGVSLASWALHVPDFLVTPILGGLFGGGIVTGFTLFGDVVGLRFLGRRKWIFLAILNIAVFVFLADTGWLWKIGHLIGSVVGLRAGDFINRALREEETCRTP